MRPALFELHGFFVPSYGFFVALGYLAGTLWIYFHLDDIEGREGEFWALAYAIFFSAVLGGKAGYYLLEWKAFRADPWGMLADWRTGWVFWTGFAATMLSGWVFQQAYNRLRRPRRYLPVADLFAISLSLGHIFGRVGCFLEGCCHGRPTTMPWGVPLKSLSVREGLIGVPLHPTQLYEAFGEAAIFAFLAWRVLPGIRAKRYSYGTAFFGYIFLYSVLRFVVEFFRGDDRGAFFLPGLSPSQWFSVFGAALAAALLWRQGILERSPETRSLYL
ncbi:MAG: prolipoprotein diacylglyceryl transferase [Elusimicrobia bacterium]|nr:prolipoprotein diacylglyceryl transferase [Elusimicrobiota bacterium]